jgi:hypothetical protein
MALGRYPDRTILLQVGELRPFSDIGGRHILHFQGTPDNRAALRGRLRLAGCSVSEHGTDWLTVGSDYFGTERTAGVRTIDLALDNPKVIE